MLVTQNEKLFHVFDSLSHDFMFFEEDWGIAILKPYVPNSNADSYSGVSLKKIWELRSLNPASLNPRTLNLDKT